MTEQEMRNRIKEINGQRNELALERDELERILNENKQKAKAQELGQYIGKCYGISKKLKLHGRQTAEYDLKYFKILEIENDNRNAICITIYKEGYEIIIAKKSIGLWSAARPNMMDTGERLIEYFDEISEDEFHKILQDTYNEIIGK